MDLLYVGSMMFASFASIGLASFFKSEDQPELNLPWRSVLYATGLWCFGRGMFNVVEHKDAAMWWIRFAYCSTIWLPVLYSWLIFKLLGQNPPKKFILPVIILYVVFTIANFTPTFVGDLSPKLSFRFYDDNPGFAFNIFSFIFTFHLIWIHIYLLNHLKIATGVLRNRIWIFCLASVLGFGGSGTTFPLVYDLNVYPFGVPLIALFPMVLTYAVVKFQVMDLYLLFRDTTVHLVSSLAFASIFVGIALSVNDERFYVISMILMAAVIPLAYPHVSKFVRRKINRTRLGDADRYLEDIGEKSSTLFGASFSITSLSSAALDLMTSIFPVSEVSVYFMRTKSKSLHLYARRGTQNEVLDIEANSDVFAALTNTFNVVWKGDMPKLKLIENQPLEGLFIETKGELLCPIFTSKQLSGLILLGKKNSLSEFHRKDIQALKYLAEKVEIACGMAMASEKYSVVMGEWSHSLNQITKPIEQAAGIIRDFIDLYSHDEIKEKAGKIIDRVEQLRHFHDYITNTTAISRELITGEFKKETVNIAGLIKGFAQKYESENKGIFLVDIPESPALASVNITLIDRVLTELLSNSLRHTRLKEASAKISVSGIERDGGFEVKVSDNGDGVDPQDLDRIWEAGWQQKDMNAGASGLGLAICRQTIEAHGGNVKSYSAGKGQGLEISFTIPTVKAEENHKERSNV